jgi:hypothetical protein
LKPHINQPRLKKRLNNFATAIGRGVRPYPLENNAMSDDEQWRFNRLPGGLWQVVGYGYCETLDSFADCVRFIRKYATALERQFKLKQKGK